MSFIDYYFKEVKEISRQIDYEDIESIINILEDTFNKDGRVFVIGVGGSATNASHLVNDLRKICRIEAYTPTDNVAELTARTNDEGFETVFDSYLEISKFDYNDVLFVLSVGGGNKEKNVSVNLIRAIEYAHLKHGSVVGIVGRSDGYTAKKADAVVVIPSINPDLITPHSEAFQAVVWHCIVSHPKLKKMPTKW